MTKLCPRGKAAAKRKFKVYPSAYANAYASKICAGKIKDPSGVKRKDFRGPKPTSASEGEFIKKPQPPLRNKKNFKRVLSPSEIEYQKKKKAYDTLTGIENRRPRRKGMKVGMAVTAGSQSGMGRLEKSGMAKAKKGKMMILIAIGKPKKAVKKANKGAIMKVASKLEKASKAHAGQAKTLRSIKVRGGGMAMQGMNFKGVY